MPRRSPPAILALVVSLVAMAGGTCAATFTFDLWCFGI